MPEGMPGVVASKLRPPQEPAGVIRRDRLIDALRNGPHRHPQVSLVCAPAGSGKTTLLTSYLNSTTGRAAWFQIDSRDNDPARFWAHFVATLAGDEPVDRPQIRAAWFRTGDWQAVVEAAAAYLGGLGEFTVVLDDYQLITTPSVHEPLDQLLQWLPDNAAVVISTRVDPPLPTVNRLRVRGALAEVRAAELAFDGEDARSLLMRAASVDVAPESVAGLVARTEGWAAGLYLAGLSIKRHGDPEAVLARFDGDDRLMGDYLRSEFLVELDDDTREFMVQTSILAELSAPLCEAVTDMGDSAGRLRDLERSNLLVVPLDNIGEWYRYHHLIGQWLNQELIATEPHLPAKLHRRAATWYSTAGDPEPAYHHAMAADDQVLAMQIAEQHWHNLLATGRHVTLRNWLSDLTSAAEGSAGLCLAHAQLARNTGQPADVAVGWLRRAEQLADPADAELMVRLHSNLMVHERMVGDLRAAERHGREALTVATDFSVVPEVRALLGATLAQLGSFSEAIDHLTGALGEVDPDVDPMTEVFALSHLSLPLYETGQRREARATAERAIQRTIGTNFESTPILATAEVVLGQLCLDQGQHDEAERHLTWALAGARAARSETALLHALLASARHAALTRHGVEAKRLLGEARDAIGQMPDPGRLESLVATAERHSLNRPRGQRPSSATSVVVDLTDRELAVLRLLTSELSLREIGNELYMSYNTVKGHAKAIYRKLDVHSRNSAVVEATANGLL